MAQIFGSFETITPTNSFESTNSIKTTDSDNSIESINSIETTDSDNSINSTYFTNIPRLKKYKKKSIKTKIILCENYNIELFIYNIINTLKKNKISYKLKKNYKFECCLSDNHICLLFNIYLWVIPDKQNEFIVETTHKKGNKQFLINIFTAIINDTKINNTDYDNKNSILSNPYINNIINDYIKTFNIYFINNQEESYYKLLCTLNELCFNTNFHICLINNNTHKIILNFINNNELLTNNDIICHLLALSCLVSLSVNDMFKKEIEITRFNNIKKTTKKYINEVIDNKINKILINLQK